MNKNVCGVVVFYKPTLENINNVNSYLDQVDFLVIVDNSESENKELTKKFKDNSKVEYVFNGQNLGIAKALNIGAEIAIQKGYKYLLTMDQDSIASENMVEKLLNAVEDKNNIGIISPLHTNKFNTHTRFTKPLERLPHLMASGNLLNLQVYKKVGGFKDYYFIDYVDIEYCLRLQLHGFEVIRVNSVLLEHNEADMTERTLFKKKYYPLNHKPFRFYYKTRNLLLLKNEYGKELKSLMKDLYIGYGRVVIKMLLFEKQKLEKSRMICLGIIDYLKGLKNGKN